MKKDILRSEEFHIGDSFLSEVGLLFFMGGLLARYEIEYGSVCDQNELNIRELGKLDLDVG